MSNELKPCPFDRVTYGIAVKSYRPSVAVRLAAKLNSLALKLRQSA